MQPPARNQSHVRRLLFTLGVVGFLHSSSGLRDRLAFSAEPELQFETTDSHVRIVLGTVPVADYVFRDSAVPRPYFCQIRTPSGIQVSRQHPPDPAHDAVDHVGWHAGMWLSFGDLSGQDYWRLKARTEHVAFTDPPRADGSGGTFTIVNRYLSADGNQTVCLETCRYGIRPFAHGWRLVADSQFHAGESELVFGDQEEMGFGIRVATPLAVDSQRGGRILDDAGRINGGQIWSQTSTWCDYAGTIDRRWVGMTVCAGRGNFRPAWAHARDYGLVALNPFGRKAFTGGEPSRVVVAPRQTLSLRFGVVVHESGTPQEYDPAAECLRLDATPRGETLFRRGEQGYDTFRIPALTATPQGTLLAFCEGRKSSASDEGDIDLLLRRSTDGGRSWLPMQLVHEEDGTGQTTIGNPCVVVDRDTGLIWLAMCRNNDRVLITHSADEGTTWAPPVDVTERVKDRNWGWFATGPGHGVQLARGPRRGRLVIPCDCGFTKKLQNETQHSLTIYSDDHGRTWQRGTPIGPAMDECQLAELGDGTLLLSMRNYRGRERRALAVSRDAGESWSAPDHHPDLYCPTCQAGLLACHCDGREVLFHLGPGGPGRANLGLRLSTDKGATWSTPHLLRRAPGAYSDLVELPDGSLGMLAETGDVSAYERLDFFHVGPAWWNEPPR